MEEMRPPQRFVVLGAGDDAKPLVSMAVLLGWSVTVADGRQQWARAERFPEADRVVVLEAGTSDLAVSALDAVVVMTHSYEQDRELLARVLPVWPRYLGLLGARHRSSHLIREAAEILGWSVSDCCARIYAPVGLDLGGDGAGGDCAGGDCGGAGLLPGEVGGFAAAVGGGCGGADCAGWRGWVSASPVRALSYGGSCAGVVLAAGSSRRLGRAKQMVEIGGRRCWRGRFGWRLRLGLEPVFVVISAGQDAVFGVDRLVGCTTLVNEGAAEGMASSIRLGVVAAAEAGVGGVVVMACDQPAVSAAHLRMLVGGGDEVVASEYAGRRGVPAYFPARCLGS